MSTATKTYNHLYTKDETLDWYKATHSRGDKRLPIDFTDFLRIKAQHPELRPRWMLVSHSSHLLIIHTFPNCWLTENDAVNIH